MFAREAFLSDLFFCLEGLATEEADKMMKLRMRRRF